MTDLKYMLETCVKNMVNKKISIDRLYDLFHYTPKTIDMDGVLSVDNIKGLLEFHHVFTSYGSTKVLKDVSFVIRPRELTAIVGRSGSGKSTILIIFFVCMFQILVLLRLMDKIFFNIKIVFYKTNVSVVTQKSFFVSNEYSR